MSIPIQKSTPLNTNMTLENHHFQQEIPLQMVDILVGGFNPLKNISQIGHLPQIGMKIKII